MRALRLLIGASAVTYLFRCRRPRDPSYICVRYGSRDAVALRAGRGAHQASGLGCRQPGVSGSFTWTPIGSLRSPGDPSCAFAPLLDPGRTDVPLPWRSHRCCPRLMNNEGFGQWGFRGSITQLQHLLSYASHFVLPLARKAGFRLAGWPLPGGRRTLWTTVRGFSSLGHPPLLAS